MFVPNKNQKETLAPKKIETNRPGPKKGAKCLDVGVSCWAAAFPLLNPKGSGLESMSPLPSLPTPASHKRCAFPFWSEKDGYAKVGTPADKVSLSCELVNYEAKGSRDFENKAIGVSSKDL